MRYSSEERRYAIAGILIPCISQPWVVTCAVLSVTHHTRMKTRISILHWTPRILCILAILFISLFALDSFGPGQPLGQQILAFLIHLIPSFVLLALLILAWYREYLGGWIFLLIGLGFSPIIFLHNFRMNHSEWMSLGIVLMITFPFVLVGILFILSHYYKKRHESGG